MFKCLKMLYSKRYFLSSSSFIHFICDFHTIFSFSINTIKIYEKVERGKKTTLSLLSFKSI